jgi:hypothetical protein
VGGERAKFILAAALAALALAATGCGGDGDEGPSGSSGDEEEITEVLNIFFTTTDPVQCEQVTENFFREQSPDVLAADDPMEECAKSIDPTGSAESIEVGDVEVDGSDATATVTPEGGTFAGSSVTVAMVDDGGWKIDGIDHVELEDRELLLSEIDKRAQESFGNDAFTKGNSDCIARYFREELPPEELEASIEGGEKTFIYDAVRFCLGGGTDTIAILSIVSTQLQRAGIDAKIARCVAGISIAGQKGATLEEFAADPKVQGRIENAAKTGVPVCARR